ncbi:hypothetical protein PUNSTDRAFT_122479 [Punctularia strigosozonata HHB-11173 SS5]|uniref:GATA-type domain-containing protein n=1 Tax=Punctularia strigosozonata (strain HHB-11173) TaxID=741275 RepID=R7S5D4_PUNST|nr:uncharacterized protein PUNSTDRAFT_122479 [Punctularia strigosozonata HHB-11173 SS5]EIN05132.1 hypothetical protein PUNSTDRAFT_122479 [Punctularia strigosozonata HHB-11173 SS5]
MPSILNLKFKGNKSFVAFSNLGDSDSLTKTWKVCTKVASFLEQGQRLENLSWRLWHLQNLIVDTDNAKSKREFRKLSKVMGDKLDKEKGRSIEELQAPGFRRNPSTDMIKLRAEEKERNREASQNAQPGTIKRMQFTFSVDQPNNTSGTPIPVAKPDLKPSAEFKDNNAKRNRAAMRAPPVPESAIQSEAAQDAAQSSAMDLDQPLTQRGRKSSVSTQVSEMSEYTRESASLRFPSLFTSDFGPSALLNPTPTTRQPMTYGEGLSFGRASVNEFGIMRPTLEIPLDELLGDLGNPSQWSGSGGSQTSGSPDIMMRSFSDGSNSEVKEDSSLATTPSLGSSLSLPQLSAKEKAPQTVAPSKLGTHQGNHTPVGRERPSLSVKTGSSRSVPGATATSVTGSSTKTHNSAPGGVKAECSNCGATHTPLWRRGLNDELNCNACGLYCKLHKRPRPKTMRNSHGEGRTQVAPRQDTVDVMTAQCYNCHTTTTPLWRKDDEGKTVCNACGLYYKLHGAARPISMKSDVIRKRSRHDARRVGTGVGETPSASPGASRRASPSAEPTLTPTLAPDSTTQMSYGEYDYHPSQSELMNALGGADAGSNNFAAPNTFASALAYSGYPGPYHPDFLAKNYVPTDALPFAATSDASDNEENNNNNNGETRTTKRRRMSTVSTTSSSATDPPLSATSYSSYDSYPSSQAVSNSHSRRSSMDFPYNTYSSYGLMRNSGSSNAFWHGSLAQTNSPQFIHPPMLPPDESPMDYLHPPMLPQEDIAEAMFQTYLHPPMLPPEEQSGHGNNHNHNGNGNNKSPNMGSQQPHPPMFPNDWNHDYYAQGNNENTAMQTSY